MENSIITLGGQVSYKVHSIPDTGFGKEIRQYLLQRGIRCEFPKSNSEEPAALLFVQEKGGAIPLDAFLWVFQPVLLDKIPLLPFATPDIAIAAIPNLISFSISEVGCIRMIAPVVEGGRISHYFVKQRCDT